MAKRSQSATASQPACTKTMASIVIALDAPIPNKLERKQRSYGSHGAATGEVGARFESEEVRVV